MRDGSNNLTKIWIRIIVSSMTNMEAEYAWCAGMFEGEGSVRSRLTPSSYIHTNGKRSSSQSVNIELKVTSTDLFPLELFNDIFDNAGSIYTTNPNFTISKQKRTAKLYKIRYDLTFCNYKAVKHIYTNIEFWLSPRRKDQCETALAFFEANVKRGR